MRTGEKSGFGGYDFKLGLAESVDSTTAAHGYAEKARRPALHGTGIKRRALGEATPAMREGDA